MVKPWSNFGQSTHLDSAAAAMRRLKRPSMAMCPTPSSSSRNVAEAMSSQQSTNLQQYKQQQMVT
jgi:hypothetical protein